MFSKSLRSANSILGFIPSLKDEQGRQADKNQLVEYLSMSDANGIDPKNQKQEKSVGDQTMPSLNLFEIIKEVEEGSHVIRCLSAKGNNNPIFIKDLEERFCIINQLQEDFQRNSEGSLEVTNPEIYQKHKDLVGSLLHEFKSVLISGKPLRSISLPVCLYESRSILERVAGNFRYVPSLLKQAAENIDPLQQFKLTLTYWVASLHTNVSLKKPFTPRTGETFQGYIGDSSVHMEQISHHPPVCLFQVYGDKFKFEGSYEFASHIGANNVKISGYGYPRVKYGNTNVTIFAQQPCYNMSGIVYGKKASYLTHRLIVFDLENKYYAEIDFDGSSGWFKKKSPIDTIKTSIWKVKDTFIEKIKQQMKETKESVLKFNEKEDAEKELCKVEGSWLEHLTVDGQRLWTFGKDMPHKIRYIENSLPSDSNFRLDVLHLKVGNEEKSQECKFMLDEIERNHKKLREDLTKDKRAQ